MIDLLMFIGLAAAGTAMITVRAGLSMGGLFLFAYVLGGIVSYSIAHKNDSKKTKENTPELNK